LFDFVYCFFPNASKPDATNLFVTPILSIEKRVLFGSATGFAPGGFAPRVCDCFMNYCGLNPSDAECHQPRRPMRERTGWNCFMIQSHLPVCFNQAVMTF
jgi:hypothetical protein